MEENNNLKNILEAILFASGEPISINVLGSSLDISAKEIKLAVEELQDEYSKNSRGIAIVIMDTMVQMSTSEKYAELVEEVLAPIRSEKLTKSAIEVLSIIAYRQPITRSEIAEIRGVRSDYLINTLIKKGLVEESGKKDTLGHPSLFSTTSIFLRDFNLKDLSQLPKLNIINEEDLDEDFENITEENIANEAQEYS